jgi:hypothetical protein
MLGLWLLIRVSDEKRQELVQSLSSFYAGSSEKPWRRFILQDLYDESLVGWLGYWRTEGALLSFLDSATFHAMKGAADTLGRLEDVQRLSLHALRERS